MKKLFEKIKNRSGETIAETLVALLIAALALVMLAGAISTTTEIITRSSTKINNYFDAANTTLTDVPSDKTHDLVIAETNDSGTAISGATIKIKLKYGENDKLTNDPVIAFRDN